MFSDNQTALKYTIILQKIVTLKEKMIPKQAVKIGQKRQKYSENGIKNA